jgi:glyoxylase-like metal-dependent hydrolase (beta-lactamase superfamily II)
MAFWICATCAVEHAEKVDVCAICDDERQWVPADGQRWTTLEELAADGHRVEVTELEPDLFGITATGKVGIGQTAKLVRTPSGNLLWDPIGYLDDDGVAQVRALGDVAVIVASHPHMYGVQVEWSRALGGVPVLVAEADRAWVARPDPVVETWSGRREVLPGVTLTQPGGHFPGSAVAHWTGADGKGVLLSGDTVFANPDRRSVAFMRSYPNHLPLSAAVTQRVARALAEFTFDRLYGNFATRVDADAQRVVRRSAERHVGWVRGDFDHLT